MTDGGPDRNMTDLQIIGNISRTYGGSPLPGATMVEGLALAEHRPAPLGANGS